ncbi:MAG: SIMPL domain-containing protein [Candidatus Hydrothermia bacterium]
MNLLIATILLSNGASSSQRTIYLNVMGEAAVEPDMATVSFTVSATANSAKSAYTKAENKLGDVQKKLKGAGASEATVQSLYVSPQYSYDGSQLLGYTVSLTCSADIPDLSKMDKAIAALSGDKDVVLSGVGYGVKDPSAAVDKAITDAAGRLGSKLDEVKRLTGIKNAIPWVVSLEVYTPSTSYQDYYYYGGYGVSNRVQAYLYITYLITDDAGPAIPDSLLAMSAISCSGWGEAPVKPSAAVAFLNITATKPTAAEAYAEAEKTLGDLKKKLGKDVELSTVSVYTTPEYGADGVKILAYTVTRSVQVRSENLKKTGEIMDVATGVDGVALSSMYYENKSSDKEESEARAKAFVQAKARAGKLASAMGLKLGGVSYFSENVTKPMTATGGYSMAQAGGDQEGESGVSYGSLTTSVNLYLSFSIRR